MEGYYMERAEERKMQRLQREKQVKKQRTILFILLFAVVLVVAVLSISHFAYASADTDNLPRAKYYKSIMIYSGDTLDSIAEKYISDEYASTEQYIYEVSCMNYLSEDTTLIAGNYLVIPYYTDNVSIQVASN